MTKEQDVFEKGKQKVFFDRRTKEQKDFLGKRTVGFTPPFLILPQGLREHRADAIYKTKDVGKTMLRIARKKSHIVKSPLCSTAVHTVSVYSTNAAGILYKLLIISG